MSMLKTLALAAIATGVATASFAGEVPERIKKAGKIVIATQPNYPPIAYKDPATNKLMGFDIDLGEAIAKELGLTVEWQEIVFAQMLPSLTTGRVDMVMAGMSDIPTRRETVDFVDYMQSGAQFYTTTAGSATIKTPLDLCGKTVGASRSTNWPKQMGEWSDANCKPAGKPEIKVVGTEGSVDARAQLKTGRLDAAVQGNETLPYLQSIEPNTYVLLGTPFTAAITGIPFPKAETQLRDAVRDAIVSLQKKGEYAAILKKYGLDANGMAEIGINQGQ
jgi:polar amino acid transport system substrate-binding protein